MMVAAVACGSQKAPPASSPSASATPGPSAAQAVWKGKWEFKYTLVKMQGVQPTESQFAVGSQIRRVWEITAGCPDRPCNSQIVGTDPDYPQGGQVKSVVSYEDGRYQITQSFPPEPAQGCVGSDNKLIPGAFEATNVVEARPTRFKTVGGRTLVAALSSTKVTTFTPTGPAAGAGGTCTLKTATWQGTASPVS